MTRILQYIGIVFLISLLASCKGKEQPIGQAVTPISKHLTITPTDKPIYAPTKTELPIQPATPTIENLLSDCWIPTGLTSQESPDGQWIAAPCDLGEFSHLEILNKQKTNVWKISFQEITGISPCWASTNRFGDPICFDGILQIHHWDKDSRYVFVNVDYVIDRGINFSYGLYRLNVETHQVSPWLKTSLDYTYHYAFSPDHKSFAYTSSADPYTIYISSIETGKVTNYKITGQVWDVGYLTWSPDNQKVAFSILHDGWFDHTGGFSLALLDTMSGKIRILINNDQRLFYPTSWLSEAIINLSSRMDLLNYQYNIQTNKLSENP